MESESKCPVSGGTGRSNRDWWPNQLDLSVLHQNPPMGDPMGTEFDYAEEFKTLDLDALKRDIVAVMTTSQDWWPADYGHYGPLFIRMAWHSAGTYRISDGRGGAGSGEQRFAPLNSWPDNANLDKARRLLWPVKQKYGRKISWADLMVLAGNCALESMGFKTFGFAGGREDVWEPEQINWGTEDTWLGDERYSGDRELANPLAAVQMGLIYVNPEGPNGNPDPLAAARDIRETFRRMAMNDEETVALIAGGHTFGKTHGAGDAAARRPRARGRPPPGDGPRLEEQLRHRQGWRHHHQRAGGRLDAHPGDVGQQLLRDPVRLRVGADEEPCRCVAVGADGSRCGGRRARCPRSVEEARPGDAHDGPRAADGPGLRADLAALPREPAGVRRRLRQGLVQADAPRHGTDHALPRSRWCLRSRSCGRTPSPRSTHELIGAQDIAALKGTILASGLSVSQLVSTAWASASTFRGTDKRGGANGARIRLAPQKDWEVNNPAELATVLQTLEGIQQDFNSVAGRRRKRVSLADLIVLGGCAAVEQAAKNAGYDVEVPFAPGRTDASQEQTDVESFAVLEPTADGFRNYLGKGHERPAEQLLVDRAQLLTLTAPEMTVLVGGLRVLEANYDQSELGVLTTRPEALTNDFFVNLLDLGTTWQATSEAEETFEGRDRETGELKWTGSRVDLVFGSNSQLRALAEVYASDDSQQKFVRDFVAAWDKVMNLDRFDLA